MNTSVVGVDMGGTKILAAVVDATGNILGTAKIPTEAKKENIYCD
jgi:glucokinase